MNEINPSGQVLAYSTAAVQERLDYLASLGLERAAVVGMLARLPQVLSLDIARNLAPKVEYLSTHLMGHAGMLAATPAYLTLSLQHRQAPGLTHLPIIMQ